MNDPEKPIQRKIKEGLDSSQAKAEDALNTGVEVLMRIRTQNEKLTHASETLSPLASMAESSNQLMGNILGSLGSGKKLFFLLAGTTIIILYLVIRWKKSR